MCGLTRDPSEDLHPRVGDRSRTAVRRAPLLVALQGSRASPRCAASRSSPGGACLERCGRRRRVRRGPVRLAAALELERLASTPSLAAERGPTPSGSAHDVRRVIRVAGAREPDASDARGSGARLGALATCACYATPRRSQRDRAERPLSPEALPRAGGPEAAEARALGSRFGRAWSSGSRGLGGSREQRGAARGHVELVAAVSRPRRGARERWRRRELLDPSDVTGRLCAVLSGIALLFLRARAHVLLRARRRRVRARCARLAARSAFALGGARAG